MEGITTGNRSWFSPSEARCSQIIESQLVRRIPVDLAWYESLCDFLSKCFSCCSDSPITHAEIINATRSLALAQTRIHEIIQNGSGNRYADEVFSDLIKVVNRVARSLARVIEGQNSDYEIDIMPDEQCLEEPEINSDKLVGTLIRKKGVDEISFLFCRVRRNPNDNPEFRMVFADPEHPGCQGAIQWQTNDYTCHIQERLELSDSTKKKDYFKTIYEPYPPPSL